MASLIYAAERFQGLGRRCVTAPTSETVLFFRRRTYLWMVGHFIKSSSSYPLYGWLPLHILLIPKLSFLVSFVANSVMMNPFGFVSLELLRTYACLEFLL